MLVRIDQGLARRVDARRDLRKVVEGRSKEFAALRCAEVARPPQPDPAGIAGRSINSTAQRLEVAAHEDLHLTRIQDLGRTFANPIRLIA